jgi:hypothetical protein
MFCSLIVILFLFLLLKLQKSDNLETELRKLKKELEHEKVENCSKSHNWTFCFSDVSSYEQIKLVFLSFLHATYSWSFFFSVVPLPLVVHGFKVVLSMYLFGNKKFNCISCTIHLFMGYTPLLTI